MIIRSFFSPFYIDVIVAYSDMVLILNGEEKKHKSGLFLFSSESIGPLGMMEFGRTNPVIENVSPLFFSAFVQVVLGTV